jgi:hypothetical protein
MTDEYSLYELLKKEPSTQKEEIIIKNSLSKLNQNLLEEQKRIDEQLSKLPEYPEPGDIFFIEDYIELQWVVLKSHNKNKNFLLTVPADDGIMVGSMDIEIDDGSCNRIILRCGQTVWIDKDDFNQMKKLRIGVLDNWHRQRAIDKINQIKRDKLRSTTWQRATDINPDYKEWMILVNQGHLKPIKTRKKIIAPRFAFEWRLNPQRKLRLNLNWLNGSAKLTLSYDEDATIPPEDTLESFYLSGYCFKLEEDDEEWIRDLKPEEVSQIAKALGLPKHYQNWQYYCNQIQNIRKKLHSGAKLLLLTNMEQAIINFLVELAEQIGMGARVLLNNLLINTLTVKSEDNKAQPSIDLLNPLVTKIETIEEKQHLSLAWIEQPEKTPEVIIKQGNQEQSKMQSTWEGENYSHLIISNLELDIEWMQAGACWNKESGELEVCIQ